MTNLLDDLQTIVKTMEMHDAYQIISSPTSSKLQSKTKLPAMSAHQKMLEAHSSKTLRIHTDSLREALGGVITPQSTLIIHRCETSPP